MSKAKTNEQAQQPSPYDELLKNGTAVLSAKTREELAELVNNIPAVSKYAVGAVGRTNDGSLYTIRIDIINT